MEQYLSDKQIRKIAERTTNMVVERMMLILGAKQEQSSDIISVKDAARMLGISEGTMRRNKDQFPHIKLGNSNQSRVMFYREALENYIKGVKS